MRDFTVWVSYGKWRKNWDIRYCLLHLIHLSSTRLRRCGRILSGICEPFCLITPDLTMRYCPILILIDYIKKTAAAVWRVKYVFSSVRPSEKWFSDGLLTLLADFKADSWVSCRWAGVARRSLWFSFCRQLRLLRRRSPRSSPRGRRL